jgi:hypothetical protein
MPEDEKFLVKRMFGVRDRKEHNGRGCEGSAHMAFYGPRSARIYPL